MQIPAQRLFSNRKLITMIIPLILENFFILLVGFVDGIMVSTVGEAAISGISLVNSISGIVISLFVSLSAGAQDNSIPNCAKAVVMVDADKAVLTPPEGLYES